MFVKTKLNQVAAATLFRELFPVCAWLLCEMFI